MKTRRSSRGLALVGAGLAVVLAGCGGSGEPAESPTTKTQEATSTPKETPSKDSTPTEEPTETPKASVAPVPPGEVTAAGTTLSFGQPATFPMNQGAESTGDYAEGTVTLAVSTIVPGAPADLLKLQDADKYAGMTPYYVMVDVTLDEFAGTGYVGAAPRVEAHLASGAPATKVIVMGIYDECVNTEFEMVDGAVAPGSTATTCTVFLAPEGDSVSSVAYTGGWFTYPSIDDNPFWDAPVVWQ